jgi:hypothetical protein
LRKHDFTIIIIYLKVLKWINEKLLSKPLIYFIVKLFISKVEFVSRRIVVRAHRKTFGYGFTLLVILAILGIGMPAMACDDPWRDPAWGYRKEVTIDRTKVVADQKEFPLLINIGFDPDLATQARLNGGDIIFTLGDGTTKLPVKVESYTSASGALVAWVKVPLLSSLENTRLFMYYGNPAAVDEQDTKANWVDVYKGNWRRRDIISWVQTEYNNHNSPSTFYSIGPAEALAAKVIPVETPIPTPTPTPAPTPEPVVTPAADSAPTQTQLWNDCGWSYRKSITIDHLKVAADQTDFPVLVSLSGDAGLAAHAQPTGNDIIFTLSDEVTKIPHKIESYTPTTGALTAWVKIPALSSAKNTVLYMYYGNPSSPAQQDATGNWSYRFKGTWSRKDIASWVKTKYNNQMSPGTFYTLGYEMYAPQSCATPVPTETPTPVPTATPTPVPTKSPVEPTVTPTPVETTVIPTEMPTPVETTVVPTEMPTPVETTVVPTEMPTPVETTVVPTPVPTPAFSCPEGTYSLVPANGETSGCVAVTNEWAYNETSNDVYDTVFVAFTAADDTRFTGASVALSLSMTLIEPQYSEVFNPESGTTIHIFAIELPSNFDDVQYFYVSAFGTMQKVTDGVASADMDVSAMDNPIEYIIQG